MIKKNKIISSLTFAVYIAFLTVTILHNHPFYLGSQSVITDSFQGSNNSATDPFVDDQSICRLAQLSNSSYSNIAYTSFSLSIDPITKDFNLVQPNQYFEDLILKSTHLKSPASFIILTLNTHFN